MSAATATTSSGPPPPPPLFIFRAADAETSGGISLIGGGRAVSVISNLCFVLFFLSCVSSRFFCGAALLEKSRKKASESFNTDTTKQGGEYDKYEEKRERERESRRVRIGTCVCVRVINMNQPSRAEKFLMPPGSRKLSYTPDTKLANAGEFVLMREDHTLGNMLRMELHNDPNVVFAGYQHPHPTDHRILIKVHTNGETNPVRAMREANQRLTEQVESLKTQWESELESVRDSGAI